jgi:hypothetical protein
MAMSSNGNEFRGSALIMRAPASRGLRRTRQTRRAAAALSELLRPTTFFRIDRIIISHRCGESFFAEHEEYRYAVSCPEKYRKKKYTQVANKLAELRPF